MPKHVPTFKHLLSTSATPQPPQHKRERSVNELLASSRAANPAQRELPPHVSGHMSDGAGYGGVKVWVPGVSAGSGSRGSVMGDLEEGGIHPAELLRRSQLSRRQASRSVAGPAPPPSWQSQSRSTPSSSSTKGGGSGASQLSISDSQEPVTTNDLQVASALFDHPLITSSPARNDLTSRSSTTGASKLTEYCLKTVLRYLEDEQVIYPEEDGLDHDPHEEQSTLSMSTSTREMTLGGVLREQTAYLDTHLKVAMLHLAAIQPERSNLRMSDRSLISLLSTAGDSYDALSDSVSDTPEDREPPLNTDEWEIDDLASTHVSTIHHLPLTLHPSPHTFLRILPSLPVLALTSLNLAYSIVPLDLEKLVSVLPSGLRELGLCGIRVAPTRKALSMSPGGAEVDWKRGLGLLGRKLIVLRMLDLSFPPVPLSPLHLTALLHLPANHLPSLRVLGLRGLRSYGPQSGQSPDRPVATDISRADGGSLTKAEVGLTMEEKRELVEVVRRDRSRWIEVVWD